MYLCTFDMLNITLVNVKSVNVVLIASYTNFKLFHFYQTEIVENKVKTTVYVRHLTFMWVYFIFGKPVQHIHWKRWEEFKPVCWGHICFYQVWQTRPNFT